jgi:hypothetical protein
LASYWKWKKKAAGQGGKTGAMTGLRGHGRSQGRIVRQREIEEKTQEPADPG